MFGVLWMTKTIQTDDIINSDVKEDSTIEEVIQVDYEKTDDVKMSMSLLSNDAGKLSIDNGRWTIDVGKKFAICLSEEFEQAVMSCTHLNESEWVGFIVGHDLVWTNPENNRQVRVLVAERAVILSQSRSGSSAEMHDEDVEEWADSTNDDNPMSFKTVHALNKWVKIGWVHSHCDMGCFWSTTDTGTMKEMRGVPLLLSIVYSRGKDKTLERLIRIDKNDVLFGGKYSVKKDNIDDMFVYSEKEIKSLDDIPEEIQQNYIEILKKTKTTITTVHTNPAAATTLTTYTTTKPGSGFSRGMINPYTSAYEYHDYFDAYDRTTYSTKYKVAERKTEKSVVIKGVTSQKAQDEIVSFGEQYYALDRNAKSNPTIATFLTMINKDFANILGTAKWKMKLAVEKFNNEQIMSILSYYLDTEVMIDLSLKTFHNFKENTNSLMKCIKNRAIYNDELKAAILEKYGNDWCDKIEQRLESPKEVVEVTQVTTVETPVVAEEPKPISFMPSATFTDWKDWYLYLPNKYRENFLKLLFNTHMENTENWKKVLDRLDASLSYLTRNEEEKYVLFVARVYEDFVDAYNNTPEKYKESYRVFYTSYFINAFSSYFSKYTYNKESNLQLLLNTIKEEYVKQFINDFIVQYEKDEELLKIIEKYPKDFPIYRQTFRCPICKIEWLLKDDAILCEENCKERGRLASEEVEEAVAESTATKPVETVQTTLALSNRTASSGKQTGAKAFLYGMPVSYFEKLNVCNYCGSLFDTQEQAENCQEDCRDFLDKAKTFYLDDDGLYVCPYCDEIFTDDDDAKEHSEKCKEYGAVIDYMFELIERQILAKGKIDVVVNRYSSYFSSSLGDAAPILQWLIDKIKDNTDIDICRYCGSKLDTIKMLRFDVRKALTDIYMHEMSCNMNVTNTDDTVVVNVVNTKNATICNGIIVCLHCKKQFDEPAHMMQHMNAVHPNIEVCMDEFNAWVMSLSEYVKISDAADEFFTEEEDLGIMFEEWKQNKEFHDRPMNICEACGEVFIIENINDAEKSIWDCFLHEMGCVNFSFFDISLFTCAVCKTIYATVRERAACEKNHGVFDDKW